MNSTYKIGILGGGCNSAVGYAHISSLRLSNRFEIVAGYFSRNRDENFNSHIKYGVSWTKHNKNEASWIEEVGSKCDLILILTPSDMHFNHLKLCIDYGIDAISEKPICCNKSEAINLRSLINKSSNRYFYIHNYSGYPMFRDMCLRIKDDHIGKIHSINAFMLSDGYAREVVTGKPQKWRQSDGKIPMILLDLATHLYHLIGFCIENQGKVVGGVKSTLVNSFDVIDNVKMTQITNGGVEVFYWVSKAFLGLKNKLRIEVYGSNGAIIWDQGSADEIVEIDLFGNKVTIDRGNLRSELDYMTRFKAGHPTGFIDAFANYYYDIANALDSKRSKGLWINDIHTAIDGIQFLEDATTKLHHHESN